jgi:hypothetical protein
LKAEACQDFLCELSDLTGLKGMKTCPQNMETR